jgi:hypothetical protein
LSNADIVESCTNRNLVKLVLKQQYLWGQAKGQKSKSPEEILCEFYPRLKLEYFHL